MDVKERQTDSTFVFGKDMTVKGAGVTQVATRPGSMIVTNLGSAPGLPTLLAQGALNGQLGALEGRRATQSSSGGGGGSGRSPDNVAQTSGLSTVNSNQSVRIVAPGAPDNFGSGPGPRNRNFNDAPVTALTNANTPTLSSPVVQDQQKQIEVQKQAETPVPPTPPLPPPPVSFPTSFPTAGGGGQVPSPAQPPAGSAPLPNLPQTGAVTYAGDMFGTANGRFATGSYQNNWSFANRSGNFTATFDGARFQGQTFANGNSSTYNTRGPVASSNTNRQMELNGTFFGRGNQPDYQIGFFNVQGQRYSGSGVYIGEKR